VVSSWGAGLVALNAPDRTGRLADIVLGFDSAQEYAAQSHLYFGCTIGRVANRIRGASRWRSAQLRQGQLDTGGEDVSA
jgi:aldose 1-epimerase